MKQGNTKPSKQARPANNSRAVSPRKSRVQKTPDWIRRAVEGGRDGFWEWNIARDEVRVTPRLNEILRQNSPPAVLTSGAMFAAMPAEDVPALRERMQRVIADRSAGDAFEHEHRFLRADGSVAWVSTRATVTERDDSGRGLTICGLTTDITERKHAEEISQALLSLGSKLNEVHTFVEAARAIYSVADRFWKWDAGTLDVYHPETDTMESVIRYDVVDGVRQEVEALYVKGKPTPRMKRIMTAGSELVLRHPPFQPLPDTVLFGDSKRFSATIMAVPLRRDGVSVGVMSVQSYDENAYNAADLEILKALADHCGGAVERIRAVESLRRSEERLSYAMSGATDGLWDWDLATNEVHYSKRWQEMLGYSDAEIGNSLDAWERFLSPEDLARTYRMVEDYLAGRIEKYEIEFRLRHKQGHWLDILSRATAIRDASGKPIRLIGVHVDITARKMAEESLRELLEEMEVRVLQRTEQLEASTAALRANEERLRLVERGTNDGVWDWNILTGESYLSARWKAMLGYAEDELPNVESTFFSRLHPEDIAVVQRAVADHLERGKPYQVEFRLRHKDGSYRWVFGRGEAVRDATGRPVRMAGSVTDVTERVRAEQELRAIRNRLEHLISSSATVTYSCRPSGNFGATYISENIFAITGFTPSDFTSDDAFWINHVHPEDCALVHAQFERLFAKGAHAWEYRFLTSSGSYIWTRDDMRVVRVAQGEPVEIVGCWMDISLRKEAEDQLRQYSDRLESLSRRLVESQEYERQRLSRELHDQVGQSLTAIQINLQHAQRHALSAEVQSRVTECLELVDQLVQQTQDMSLGLRPSLLDDLGLEPALRWLVDAHATRSGLRIEYQTADLERRLDPAIEIACFRVAQEALTNVFRHAQAREVTVSLQSDDSALLLTVHDDGQGFDPAARRQAGARYKDLGLLGMEERVAQVGGWFDIESNQELGTTVSARFPLRWRVAESQTDFITKPQ